MIIRHCPPLLDAVPAFPYLPTTTFKNLDFIYHTKPTNSTRDSITAIMVHLASVPNDSAREKPLVEGMQNIDINQDEDEQTVSVYGSRFASQELPAHEMPEQEMPKEVAYRMIRDDLSLDGNPMLNLASFVTTYMASSLGRARYTNVMKKLTIIRRKRSRS